VSFEHPNPSTASCPAISRSDNVLQVSADIGSPRLPSSSKLSSASANPGCTSSARGRPAPGRRDRPAPSAPSAPASAASAAPAATVVCDTPAARATAAIPP
jgi:hypothetical protein